mmetsp:Transcript_19803/g.57803  ORF Transcript_19803/g.57803 Transcript_19803/m.57803 type:complete len:258 (+) Transcript_19803:259-1032(+)
MSPSSSPPASSPRARIWSTRAPPPICCPSPGRGCELSSWPTRPSSNLRREDWKAADARTGAPRSASPGSSREVPIAAWRTMEARTGASRAADREASRGSEESRWASPMSSQSPPDGARPRRPLPSKTWSSKAADARTGALRMADMPRASSSSSSSWPKTCCCIPPSPAPSPSARTLSIARDARTGAPRDGDRLMRSSGARDATSLSDSSKVGSWVWARMNCLASSSASRTASRSSVRFLWFASYSPSSVFREGCLAT